MENTRRDNLRKYISNVAQAHTDLSIFSSVISLLEGGAIYTKTGHTTAARIIKICSAEAQRQLKSYDKNCALLFSEAAKNE